MNAISRRISLAVIGLASALFVALATAQSRFDFVGNLNGQFSSVRSLSFDGRSAAGFDQGVVGFRWTRSGGREDFGLPLLGSNGLGISNDGLVVTGAGGFVSDTTQQAFRRLDIGTVEGLGFLSGYAASGGVAVSRDGSVVVGTAYQTNGQVQEPFRWSAATGMKRLSGSPGGYGQARDVSGDGNTVVGTINPGNILNPQRAFVWNNAAGFNYLADEIGNQDNIGAYAVTSDARFVSGAGLVNLGSGVTFGAIRWDHGVPMSLGAAPGGYLLSSGGGMSDDGSVIIGGYGNGNTVNLPFVWTSATGMVNALDYLRGMGVQFPADTLGIRLFSVSGDGLSFGGDITAPSLPDSGGGFVATVPSPTMFTILAVSGLAGIHRRPRR